MPQNKSSLNFFDISNTNLQGWVRFYNAIRIKVEEQKPAVRSPAATVFKTFNLQRISFIILSMLLTLGLI
jgi:hypothetical protein